MVTDSKSLGISRAYVTELYKGAKIEIVNSWDELAKLLKRYSSIKRLILSFHGTPGSLIIGGTLKGLRSARSMFDDYAPSVNRIDFEGCCIAEAPDAMYDFAKVFKTSLTTGYNYFNINNSVLFTIYEDTERDVLRAHRSKYEGYFVLGAPSLDHMLMNPATYTLWYEWFRREYNSEDLPEKRDLRKYRRRRDAYKRRVAGSRCKSLRKEYESPAYRFEYVIVNVKR